MLVVRCLDALPHVSTLHADKAFMLVVVAGPNRIGGGTLGTLRVFVSRSHGGHATSFFLMRLWPTGKSFRKVVLL